MGKQERERARQDAELARMPQVRLDEMWQWAADVREAYLSDQARHRRGVRRRKMLGWTVGIGTGLYLAANGLIKADIRSAKEHWGETQTRILRLDDCASWFPLDNPPIRPDEACITVGGLGCVSSYPHAKPMGDIAFDLRKQETTPMSYLVTSNQGKSPEDLAKILIKESQTSKSLSFYGQSNGGPTILEALHLAKANHDVTIPVKRLILNCSPFNFDDARENFVVKAMARIISQDYRGGVYSKFLYQFWDKYISQNPLFISRIKEAAIESIREATNESPAPWLSDLYNLCHVDLDHYDFTDIITPDTEILYLMSPEDDVVRNNWAAAKYAELAGKYGAKFSTRMMAPGTKHGDSVRGSETAKPWVRQTSPRNQTV